MSKKKKIIILIVALCVLGFLLTIGDYLALHDIRSEYVSVRILKYLNITLSEELQDWTATKEKWSLVGGSYFFRLIFFILCAILFCNLNSRIRTDF